MRVLTFRLRGLAPALMQCDRLANPLDPLTIELKKLTSVKRKTEETHRNISEHEFKANLYYDADNPKLGPYWPAQNIDAMFRSAAKFSKRGEDVKRGFMCLTDKVPLLYEGPRTPDGLWKAGGEFVDMRSVVVQRAKTIRTRPIFCNWEVEFDASYDEDIFDAGLVIGFAKTAGLYVGLSMYRPRFGRFEVVSAVEKEMDLAA